MTKEKINKELVLKIIEREKQRLDNLSVFGGFSNFLSSWFAERGEGEDFSSLLLEYDSLTVEQKRKLLQDMEEKLKSQSDGDGELNSPSPVLPSPEKEKSLSTPVRYIKGVGPALEKKLNRLEIKTAEDLLFFFPRYYRDRGEVKPISHLRGEGWETIQGVVSSQSRIATRRGPLLKIAVSDGTGKVNLVCFNRNYLAKTLRKGVKVQVSGNFRRSFGNWEVADFDYQIVDQENSSWDRIVPIYSLTEGLSLKKLQSIIYYALDNFLEEIKDILPSYLVVKHNLLPKRVAIEELHRPSRSSVGELNSRRSKAHLTIIFEEFLLFALSLKIRRQELAVYDVPPCVSDSALVKNFLAQLPFTLTSAQKRVVKEIHEDLVSGRLMNRLIQGDVGSGKTLVALLAALQVIDSGRQVALMVPTEILAEQHYHRFKDLLSSLGVRVGLLKGGTNKEKKELVEKIKKGEIDLVIGTHALIEENITFPRLGLTIVDEQHRFGVLQRAKLKEKASIPHLLVMTATPIPRTLALTLYGDLDISVVDEKPAGRKPVTTLCFSIKERFKAYNRVRKQIEEGRQAFVVCPAIEESEEEISNVAEVTELLRSSWLSGFRIEMIHGKLPSREKEEIMERFSRGDIDVLVATSVIEVGIDIPNASVMVIENAERFGLAQLHQLRGRIGRGEAPGLCILLAEAHTEEARRRMEIMVATEDGFRIAEEDLRLRGPGEFYGVRQHGVPEFRLADPFEDWSILEKANEEAKVILDEDPRLEKSENRSLQEEIDRRFGRYLEFGEVS
ncbi:MAG TPA: ATP-dependent DNA helicase RecG [Candidatus Atribacteria bacterium]|nr:ATP-dependent DNA helicase RecG [Candidatus Atribacteria bacterium]